MMPKRPPLPDRPTRLRLAAAEYLDVRTVAKAYAGRPIAASSYHRVVRAAQSLGLPPPPPASVSAQDRHR